MDQTIQANLSILGGDDLIDAYEKLADSYRTLKTNNEKLQQKVYEQNRSLQLVTANEAYLQNELETLSSVHEKEFIQINQLNSTTLEDLKTKNQELIGCNSNLESKTENLIKELNVLKHELEHLKLQQIPVKSRLSEDFSRIISVEQDNLDLKCTLKEQRKQVELLTNLNSDYKVRLTELRESISCLEANLESKKQEIEEKNDLIESSQEKYQELSVELAMIKTAPEDGNRKGNSLFAEVDDHRQKMKHVLESQNQHYSEMKNALRFKELEIRGLKRQNINIKQEISMCQNLFLRADQASTQSLNNQITQLSNEKLQLETKVKLCESKLLELAKDNSFDWIQTFLENSNDESKNLKEKLYNSLIEKNLLAENYHRTQKEFAKSKLEGIKMKLLLGKIVDQHQIEINPTDLDGINIDSESLKCYKDSNDSVFSSPPETSNDCSVSSDPNYTALLNESVAVEQNKENSLSEKKFKIPENVVRQTCQISNLRSILTPKIQNAPKFNEIPKQSVQFSEIVKTEHIANTQEQIQDANIARKKFNVEVKRIQIVSKPNKS